MIGYVEAPRAFWLARGMARTAGVPLARAVVEGWVSRADFAQMISRCQSCAKTDACTSWLAVPRTGTPPEFCAIRRDIEALAPLHQA